MADDEGTDKHDEADNLATGVAEGITVATSCVGCGRRVYAVPTYPTPRCDLCGRAAAGVRHIPVKWGPVPPSVPNAPFGPGTLTTTGVHPLTAEMPTTELCCFWCEDTWAVPLKLTPLQITQRLDEHEREHHPQTLEVWKKGPDGK